MVEEKNDTMNLFLESYTLMAVDYNFFYNILLILSFIICYFFLRFLNFFFKLKNRIITYVYIFFIVWFFCFFSRRRPKKNNNDDDKETEEEKFEKKMKVGQNLYEKKQKQNEQRSVELEFWTDPFFDRIGRAFRNVYRSIAYLIKKIYNFICKLFNNNKDEEKIIQNEQVVETALVTVYELATWTDGLIVVSTISIIYFFAVWCWYNL